MAEAIIRNAEQSDLDSVMDIQRLCYTEIEPESRSSMQNRLSLFPDSFWVVESSGNVLAYIICHPWNRGTIPELDTKILNMPEYKELFYIHDLSVSPDGRGQGLGFLLVEHAISFAKKQGYEKFGLVAIQGASKFWEKFGFIESNMLSRASQKQLSAYGGSAIYMESLEVDTGS